MRLEDRYKHVVEGAMSESSTDDATSDNVLFILAVSVSSVVTLIVVVFVCLCCQWLYKTDDEHSDDEDSEAELSPYRDTTSTGRDDLKTLRHHSWKERVKAPFLTRKSIRMERPGEKTLLSEQVQPDPYAHTTINDQLGLKGRDGLFAMQTSAESPVRSIHGTDNDSLHGAAGAKNNDDVDGVDESETEYCVEKLGRIQFNLKYDFQEMTLTLKIMRAIELPAKDFSGTSDPYVKIMLLPDKKHKLQTNIKRRNLNPRWNEVFAFEGFPYAKLQSRILYMQVLDYDRFSRDDPIGEIALPLNDVDLANGHTYWKTLQPCKGHAGKLGELLISLCYQPTVGRITFVVIKARDLKAKDINGMSDPYVKIWMCHEGKKSEKKKTTIKEKTLNPVFNESFIFSVPYEKIRQTSLVISVMDYDRMGRNELIGQINLGSKSGPMEVKHWNEMFSKSRQPVAQWHILKDFS